jgi:radical SAM superfamily enzyme YgiQ (UPF0313 family)
LKQIWVADHGAKNEPIKPAEVVMPRLLLIAPRWGKEIMRNHFQFPPLGLAMVAAVTPQNFDVEIVDENVQQLDLAQKVDLVGMTAMTCQAPRAYELAGLFRERGVPTVIGGPHPSLLPDESKTHVDSVVIGEAEEIWPKLIRDFELGNLKPVYKAGLVDITALPFPRRDLLKLDRYQTRFHTLQTTRGCPFDCEFCSVTTLFSRSYRTRPVDSVVKEIELILLKAKRRNDRLFFFVDDNIVANPRYAKELFRKLAPLRIRWASQGTITTFTKDDELLELARKSGCITMFVGFESISEENLIYVNKKFNRAEDYDQNIRKIHRRGIGIIGSFIFGLEHDDPKTFSTTVKWAQERGIEAANFSVLTPYPGTRLCAKMDQERRVLSKDWSQYHALTNQVLFRHQTLSAEVLLEGTAWSWIKYYSVPSILGRLLRAPRSGIRSLPLILGYRKRAVSLRQQQNQRRRIEGLKTAIGRFVHGLY